MMEQGQAQRYLTIDEIKGVEPLDQQTGVWQKRTIPDALRDSIFGDIEPNEDEVAEYGSTDSVPVAKTYALLDAAKIPHLLLSLQHSDLSYKSLYKGKAEETYKEVAAYIVELDETSDFTRTLFTSSKMPSSLWDNNAAVYLRSRKSMDELHGHFRKFMRLYSDKKQRWMLFRFYAPEVLSTVITAFDEKQFEAFAKGIHSLACRSGDSNFLVITRSEQAPLVKSGKSEIRGVV